MKGCAFDRRRALMLGATAAASLAGGNARAAAPVQMISHRFPALEFYAGKMREAVPGVTVNTQLMPFDKANELATIGLSSKSDTLDIVYANDTTVQKYAKNGWLRPLDDLWEKHAAEFNLADFPETVLAPYRYEGRLYCVPHNVNVMLLFYRRDLFEEAGKKPPTTMDEYLALAQEFNTPMRAGTIKCLKPIDAVMNEAHWYFNTIGDGWFDKDWHPVFNSENGVKAILALKEAAGVAQRGYATAANDECTLALQQDLAVMGLQWASRTASMDDPAKSRVVDLIDWAAPPGGHSRVAADGYAISAFSKQDPDLLFRILATSSSEANMREGAAMLVPPRDSVLRDPELAKKFRHYPGILAALPTAQPTPPLPEFYEAGEFISRRILQAVAGEMEVKAALDAAAAETEQLLRSRGYYG
jgi:multiple sugar transport system substrate-binding protein